MKVLENKNFPNERDLYGANGIYLKNCTFDGIENGESALKEAKNIKLENCLMNLRYPLWHNTNDEIINVTMTENCRAALWYTEKTIIKHSRLLGIKAIRECNNIKIFDTEILSPELGWKSKLIELTSCNVESEYLFLMAEDIKLTDVKFKGKYSFQYVQNAVMENCNFDTKDAFWHSKNITVKNSIIKGEYLGWYSENLTFVNCKIIGTQPLCYCKNLKLINCEMNDTDFSFEYSDVTAEIVGNIVSVKNPKSGKIFADSITDIIYTDDSKYNCNCEIILNKVA